MKRLIVALTVTIAVAFAAAVPTVYLYAKQTAVTKVAPGPADGLDRLLW